MSITRNIQMIIILLGVPGAGKGTQAKMISSHYAIPHISTGDMFRRALADKTETGLKAKEYIDAGGLVPDEVTIGIFKERVAQKDCNGGFILDGFPRTLIQASALDELFSELGLKITAALHFYISDEIIVKRLSGRRMCTCGATFHMINNPPKKDGICDACSGKLFQRDDDKEDVVRKRLETYRKNTEPLIDYYNGKELLKNIDADRGIDAIFEDVRKILEKAA